MRFRRYSIGITLLFLLQGFYRNGHFDFSFKVMYKHYIKSENVPGDQNNLSCHHDCSLNSVKILVWNQTIKEQSYIDLCRNHVKRRILSPPTLMRKNYWFIYNPPNIILLIQAFGHVQESLHPCWPRPTGVRTPLCTPL